MSNGACHLAGFEALIYKTTTAASMVGSKTNCCTETNLLDRPCASELAVWLEGERLCQQKLSQNLLQLSITTQDSILLNLEGWQKCCKELLRIWCSSWSWKNFKLDVFDIHRFYVFVWISLIPITYLFSFFNYSLSRFFALPNIWWKWMIIECVSLSKKLPFFTVEYF